MSIKFNRSQTFSTNGTVTAAGLHNLVDGLDIYQALITDQTSLSAVAPEDSILIADASLTAGDAPRQTTVSNLFDDALTSGTYTNANLTGNLTYGTSTGNRTVSTNASITTGTINNATLGTTTGTAATFTNATATAANITNGTIQTLTSSTATITSGTFNGAVNSTAGTIGTLNSTTGTIGTLNSTTGTIGNLSTTLAGDFTISQGTGTLGTTGATAATYGTTSDIPRITVDAKGRITSATTVTAPVGFRNRLINSDMRIDQRNAGASGTAQAYSVDRWITYLSQASKFTWQQNAGSVTPPTGFSNYLGITSSSAYSVTSTDYFALHQAIEGYNVADLAWGTANAKSVTVSFYVRSSLTGTFGGVIQNDAQTRTYPFSYTISAANTWEQKTVTIAGDTTGTWRTDNGAGIRVMFSFGAGSGVSGTAGAWAATSNNVWSATGATSVVGTNGATFYITGVQLEAGSTATDFERRPYGTELALCQRYYCKSYAVSVAPATSSVEGYATNGGLAGGTANSRSSHRFPVEMRASPTMAYWDYVGNASRESSHNSSNSRTDNIASGSFSLTPSASGFGFNDAGGSGQAGAGAWWSLVHWTASAEL